MLSAQSWALVLGRCGRPGVGGRRRRGPSPGVGDQGDDRPGGDRAGSTSPARRSRSAPGRPPSRSATSASRRSTRARCGPSRPCMADLLIYSDNWAAVALAEHTAGSVEAFVELMNQKAVALGMTSTHFENPNGLDEEGPRLVGPGPHPPGGGGHTGAPHHPHHPPQVRHLHPRRTDHGGAQHQSAARDLPRGARPEDGRHRRRRRSAALLRRAGPRGLPRRGHGRRTDHMAETADLLAYAGRILGPQDHFYAAGAHLDATGRVAGLAPGPPRPPPGPWTTASARVPRSR